MFQNRQSTLESAPPVSFALKFEEKKRTKTFTDRFIHSEAALLLRFWKRRLIVLLSKTCYAVVMFVGFPLPVCVLDMI